eukprot:TRINITY_DN22021_c0_g1_i2.p1 TRINITY_DN22021_c0_g1~~TRINITY_DN22021_c0_g1_i2.p1  ORF type:complete len:585 (-),score=111.47 TRINITY_DN22021_c0_g1_i2:70-1824(-)
MSEPVATLTEAPEEEPPHAAREWVDDAATQVCMSCRAAFGFWQMRRKHHCRKCGKVVCSRCSRSRQIIPEYRSLHPQRVCDDCMPHCGDSATSPNESAVVAAAAAASGNKVKPVKLDSLGGQPLPTGDHETREFATLEVHIIEARGLLAADISILSKKSSDPYCLLQVAHGPQVRTKTVGGSLEPRWDTHVAFRLSRPESVLRVEVWDEDKVGSDDALGFLELPLSSMPASEPFLGWVPLFLPEAQPLPGEDTPAVAKGAGAVLLEVQLVEVKRPRHLLAFAAPLPAPPKPLPPFDIDALYGPLMHVVDLLWSRFISPVLFWVLGIIFWSKPLHSLAALIAWNVGAKWFLQHYPALPPLGLAFFMLSYRFCPSPPSETQSACEKRPKLLRENTAPALLESNGQGQESAMQSCEASSDVQSEYDEASLGGAVRRLCVVLPSSVKDTCRWLQPVLRTVADGLQMVHDIFTWDNAASPGVFTGLLCFAALCEVLQFHVLLMLLGTLVLLACSPILPAVSGGFAYVHWLRAKGQPADWDMRPEYDEAWSSKDFKDPNPKDSRSLLTSGTGLLRGKTLGTLFSRRGGQD